MKEDKKVPQLRFPEFTDAWKQRKFSDSFDFLQNNTLSRASLNDTSGCAKNVHYGDILVKFGESISAEKADLPFICDREILKKLSKSILKNGDVVIADTAEDMTTGKSCEIVDVDECMPVLAGLHTIPVRPKQKFGKYYLGYYLNSEAFHSQLIPLIQGIKVYSISKSSIKDTVVMFPDDVQEQEKIGSLFNRIDNTITLQQRKLNSLQKLKKGLLQKMFPKNGENIPEIRFPEFSDAWKQRELGEIAERVTRRNSSLESQTPLTISAEYGLIDQNKFFGKRIAAKDLSNYYLIQKGEFAYNKSTSNDAPWGAIKRLDCYNNGALSTLYIVFKIKDNKSCYSDFLVTYYGTSLWHKEVKEIASEGARNHGLLNVSPSDFFRTKLVIPQDFEEQRKIGAFFTQLDNTITLQQRKLESLQKLKKGLLQQMFI